MLGREVKTLVDSRQGAGSHRITWDGTDASNRSAPLGVYLYQLTIRARTEVSRMVLLGD
jgi:flagellar hook assembly protein FlgD